MIKADAFYSSLDPDKIRRLLNFLSSLNLKLATSQSVANVQLSLFGEFDIFEWSELDL